MLTSRDAPIRILLPGMADTASESRLRSGGIRYPVMNFGTGRKGQGLALAPTVIAGGVPRRAALR